MIHACPHCGKEVNPAAMLGRVRTAKREAAWKRNGERLKIMYANARKIEFAKESDTSERSGASRPPTPFVSGGLANGVTPAETRLAHDTGPFIAPKGSFSKEDLKALIAGNRGKLSAPPIPIESLLDTPAAPFDLSIEGEPHRVRQLGKGLWLVFLGPDGEKPIRQLKDGELEQLWEKRNK